ncbi:MAG: peroxidase [Candidatus Binataceae bacterium]
MAWIRTIPEDEATGVVAQIYAEIRKGFPIVPNVMKAFSARPELLDHMRKVAMTATFGGSRLTRTQEEMIATVVSSLNRCHY